MPLERLGLGTRKQDLGYSGCGHGGLGLHSGAELGLSTNFDVFIIQTIGTNGAVYEVLLLLRI